MGRALVTSARTRVAYNICKSLARRGVEVVVADAQPHAMSFHSRHAVGTARYVSPFVDEHRFIDDLVRLVEQERIDVLIPVLEETYMVARHRDRLPARAGLCLAGYRALVELHDKESLRTLANRLGVPMPETVSLAAVLASPGMAGEMAYPQVVKPRQGGGGWAVEEVTTPDRLRALASERAASGGLAQRKLDGDTVCVAMLYDAGKMVASDTYRVIQAYPWPYGQGTLRESFSCPAAEQVLRTLLDAMAWTGVCEADFIVEPVSGRAFLIDVKPRFWGSLAHSLMRGMDFPYYSYKLARNERDFRVPESAPGVVTRWLGGDVMRLGAQFVNARDKAAFLVNALRGHRRVAAYDDFDLSDPLPMLAWCCGQATKAVRRAWGMPTPGEGLCGQWE